MAGIPDAVDRASDTQGHARWVRISHWIGTVSILTLAFTGFVILMAHPRLYWGDVGNDLTPALLELPISRNYQHRGFDKPTPFFQDAASPVTASRTYQIFNQNGWGRSLHFLAAWCLALLGVMYVLAGIFGGHFRSHILPKAAELAPHRVWHDVVDHLRLRIPPASGGPQYGLLQKLRVLICDFCCSSSDGSERSGDVAGSYFRVSVTTASVWRFSIRADNPLLHVRYAFVVPYRASGYGHYVRIQTSDPGYDTGGMK